jgi:ATP-dependent RNA helicase MSS116, mitochondrial
VKAKTGTGKTLGFLIPSVEVLLRRPPLVDAIQCLIMSPTRELALQIANEAESLLTFNQKVKKVVTVVGGTNINSDKKHLSGKVDFLVATPGNSSGVYICNLIVNYLRHGNLICTGRLIDLLENFAGFSERLRSLRVLIFDEADQLLDMGFRPAIETILKHVPPKV